jgi:hypothetical protein
MNSNSYYKTYNGTEFNQLYPLTTFFKITNKDEVHFGLPYRTGTNTLKQGEVYHPTYSGVGLYFFRMEDFIKVYSNNLFPSQMHWIRTVTIPNDATVTMSGDYCFKTDRFVLGERERFFVDNYLSESQVVSSFFLSSEPSLMLETVRAPTMRMYAQVARSYRGIAYIPEFILRQRLFWFALIRYTGTRCGMECFWQYVPEILRDDETFWIDCANEFGYKIIEPGVPISLKASVYDKMYRRRSKRLKKESDAPAI